jgi:hypothetical protein
LRCHFKVLSGVKGVDICRGFPNKVPLQGSTTVELIGRDLDLVLIFGHVDGATFQLQQPRIVCQMPTSGTTVEGGKWFRLG